MAPSPLHAPQVGSGKVTDSQVAFMVECYLRDSHFSRALEEFRSEAARLLHPLRSVPKGARSLSAVLNDYVALKEEQISAAAEKTRVEDLFHGLQEILSVYLSGAPKSAVLTGGVGNGKIVHVSSPLHVQPAAMVQQPNLRGSTTVLESGNASASANQHIARLKPSASKRKSLDNSSHENLQQGDSTMDPAKKSRRGSFVGQLSTEPPPLGNAVNVDSPTGSNGNSAKKNDQPATPPMSMISSSKSLQRVQQVFSSHGSSGSPQPSSLPSELRPSLVSPSHTSTTPTPPPPVRGDGTQSHQDPQTPPPSLSIKSSSTCTSAPPAVNIACNTGTTTAQGKKGDELHRRKAPLTHLSSSTCPYSLRAHKKPSEPPSAAISNSQSNSSQKATRKKVGNSKCRLLDFSTATEKASNQVLTSNQDNRARVSPSECVDVSKDCQQTCSSSAEGIIALQSGHVPDCSPSSTQESQDSQASEFALPCDTFSFDELFDLDLDTSLISELEDLAAFTGSDDDPLSCLKTNEMAVSPMVVAEPSTRGILVDVGNLIHPDEPASLVPQSANPSASPSKAKKHATLADANELDKENMHSMVVSSSPQTSLTS